MRTVLLSTALLALLLAAALAPAEAATMPAPLTIKAKESGCPAPKTFCFDPLTATAAAGTMQAVTFDNTPAKSPHNLCFAVRTGATDCAPGPTSAETTSGGNTSSVTLDLTAVSAGSYAYWCNVPGHRQLGMEGNFTVTGTTTPTPSPTPSPPTTDKKSPGFDVAFLLVGVGLLAVAMRRN